MGSVSRTLVVEDSPSMRLLLENLLEERGHDVQSVSTAEEALELFSANPHDLLLVDWTLPKQTGLDLTRAIRSRPNGDEPYILIITGRNGPDDLLQVLDAGASDYVSKPVDSHVLTTRLAIVERHVRTRTSRRALRERLLRADRMSSVGTLAAGIAHELNNPLAYVLSNLELTRDELEREPDVRRRGRIVEQVEQAIDGARRMATIVRDLNTFSAEVDGPIEVVDAHRVIAAALHVCWNELRHLARVEQDFGAVPHVLVPRGALGQVVLNLLLHAAKDRSGHEENRRITIATATAADGQAEIAVGRDGAPIPTAELPYVFDPFFTTSASSEGAGLELAVSQNLLRRIGGTLRVESSAEEGTWLRATLPPAPPGERAQPDRPIAASRAPIMPGDARSDRARVVVVDDEPLIGRSLARLLRAHQVDVFTSGAAALAHLERLDADVDIILCDLMMPEMSGVELFGTLEERHPELVERVVFMTGGAFTPQAARFVRESGRPVLDKPFDLATVRTLVGGLLERLGGGPIAED